MKANPKRKRKSVSAQVLSIRELERLFQSRQAPRLIPQAELEEFRQEIDKWMEGPTGSPEFPYPREKADNLKALVNAGWKAEPGKLGIRCSRTQVYVNGRAEVESSHCAETMELGDRLDEIYKCLSKLADEGHEGAQDALYDMLTRIERAARICPE